MAAHIPGKRTEIMTMNKPLANLYIIRGLMLFLFVMTLIQMAQAQKEFTLDDLNYGGSNYHNMIPEQRYITWWGEKPVRLDLEECYAINESNGKEKLLISLDDINEWIGLDDSVKVRSLYYAEFPYADKPVVLVSNNKERFLVDFKRHTLLWRQSYVNMQVSDWNKSSRSVAYIENDNLYVCDAEGKVEQISSDGSRSIVYGQAVHRNEFGIEKGTFWSPDGKRLAFYRMDQSMVADYPQVDIFAREAEYAPDKYPMAGETSHKVTVGVYDIDTKRTIYLDAGDPTDRYFTNISWSPDASTIYMFELNRDQNDCRLVSYDAANGKRKSEIYNETDSKYVEPLNPIVFLPWDNTKFLMQSQKDGYNHLYLMDIYGKELRQLTKGSWVVMEMLGFNTDDKSVIYMSNEASPIQRNVYSVNVETGKRKPLDNGRGYHYCYLSDKGTKLYDNYSEPELPRGIDFINTKTAAGKNYFKADNPWKEYNSPEFKCGSIKAADGTTDLYYRMVMPVGFNPSVKYPTIVYVYGGPHAHNVDARWHYASRGWETYMAQKGYLLFILDNRGSENRGRAFEQATFRQLGQIEMQDQMMGIEYLKSLPYVDSTRIGVHGWSFGGFMTITMMTNHPDVFKVGVAGGPVIDWKWYEVMYGERYMDTPQSNPEGYEKTSLINQAKNLKGKLQVITGYNDNTVVPQHCLSFLAECIKEGTQPDFFVYPGEQHNMRGYQSVHLHERITQYFEDYLKPVK